MFNGGASWLLDCALLAFWRPNWVRGAQAGPNGHLSGAKNAFAHPQSRTPSLWHSLTESKPLAFTEAKGKNGRWNLKKFVE
jgi:hypothetical protein